MSSLGQRTFTQVFDTVRSCLNDIAGDVYTDAMLIEKAALAYLDLRAKFRNYDVDLAEVIDTSNFTYAANGTSLTVGSGVTDLLEPIEFWQRNSSTETWRRVFQADSLLPDPPSGTYPADLTYWTWDANETSDDVGTTRVNAASQAKLIWARYVKQLAYPTASAKVAFDDFYLPLAFGTAEIAGATTGRPQLASAAGARYRDALNDAIGIAVSRKQGIPRGPRPNRLPRRARRGVGW